MPQERIWTSIIEKGESSIMEKVIYDNYSLDERYEDTKEFLFDNCGEEPTESEVWDAIYLEDSLDYEAIQTELNTFFSGGTYIVFGSIGRWDGRRVVWDIFEDFERYFPILVRDCDYVKIYEENNHFFIDCSHHDGNNSFEIKRLTDRGVEYYNNWNYTLSDDRSEQYIGKKLISNYSVLPRYFKYREEA